jgi:hypothetical protein
LRMEVLRKSEGVAISDRLVEKQVTLTSLLGHAKFSSLCYSVSVVLVSYIVVISCLATELPWRNFQAIIQIFVRFLRSHGGSLLEYSAM